jgi:hypothetical protein
LFLNKGFILHVQLFWDGLVWIYYTYLQVGGNL